MIKDLLNHTLKAQNEHSIHSPFVFEFYVDVIKNKSLDFDDTEIKELRRNLLEDKREIKITDLGAGSKYSNKTHKTISEIAKTAKKSEKWAGILSRIISKYGYTTIIELGTSLGVTTAMLSKTAKYGKVYTFEGCPETLKVAKEGFEKLGLNSITPMLGDINDSLKYCLNQMPPLDFVFFDANHQYAPTLEYFRLCLAHAHENSCFVFDDIYWSEGMKKAWTEIVAHPEVSLSLDFFQMGVVFFRKNQPKQHFVLKA